MLHGGEVYGKNIDLDFSVNLNPTPCSKKVLDAIRAASKQVGLYPDREQRVFRQKVAKAENCLLKKNIISPGNVLGGNGASELIHWVIRLLSPGRVLLPIPCFYGYYHAIEALSDVSVSEYVLKPEKGFALDRDFLKEIDNSVDLVILGNPNNPTGRVIETGLLEKIIKKCKRCGCALIVDESFLYLSEGSESATGFIGSDKNLFVVSSFTKLFSIPGVRVGYVLSSEKNIQSLQALLPEWNMSVFALAAGEACADILINEGFVEKSLERIDKLRKEMEMDLKERRLIVYPSDTNFILVYSLKNLYDSFLDRGILIRDCSNFKGLDKGFFRIAVKDEKSYERIKQCFSFLM